jgi:transcription elongation GreA/GreB family factor
MKPLDKRALLAAIIEQIDTELATMTRIAREAAEAASHEENRAEGIKDMRSTEASYVARGQAERALDLERSRARLATLELRSFGASDSIESGALVQVMHQRQSNWYFVLPVAGGRRVEQENGVVLTITPTSPLGSAILGLRVGDEAEVPTPTTPKMYEVVAIA